MIFYCSFVCIIIPKCPLVPFYIIIVNRSGDLHNAVLNEIINSRCLQSVTSSAAFGMSISKTGFMLTTPFNS